MAKLGWKPDRKDARDRPYGAPGSDAGVPRRATLRRHLGSLILDQGETSSCVAHAIAYAVRTCHAAGGVAAPELLSRLFAYWTARARTGDQDLDEGTYIREAFKALAKLGFCPENDWPFDTEQVNVQPSREAFRQANDQKMPGFAYYRIGETGAARVTAVKHAIASGHPVVFGAIVTTAFTEDERGHVWGPPAFDAEIAGGHAMCLLEYTGDVFSGPQSWGRRAHGDGWFELTAGYLGSSHCSDFWAVVAPPVFG